MVKNESHFISLSDLKLSAQFNIGDHFVIILSSMTSSPDITEKGKKFNLILF